MTRKPNAERGDGPIDEVRARRALKQLDAIAAEHPELVDHAAPRWTDNLAELDRLTNGDPMAPKKNPKREPTVMYTFRLQPSLVARLDAHAERLSAATPGLILSRTDALRVILASTFDAAEAKPRRGK